MSSEYEHWASTQQPLSLNSEFFRDYLSRLSALDSSARWVETNVLP